MNLESHSIKEFQIIDLSPQDEWDLLENHYNRVTDTCIPEDEALEDTNAFI
jgi:hypothetical protein